MQLNQSGEYRSKVIALLLAFFLGSFGAHNFYLGRKGIGLTQLILTIVGYALVFVLIGFLPLAIVGIWIFVDMIQILMTSESDFDWSF
ncbi:MAG TPA: TM2 domain-containing protein [Weissella thailandensis]|uniref:TM2 domain-containing protein n=1 Tax=Weissella thailandensis TaxID=89061 RepID=UPI001DE55082|nr:TM2 domain-containing protein [Weissella thailandensis]HJG84686.1 TM2 domain-containing protein [Weissella thailandensis]